MTTPAADIDVLTADRHEAAHRTLRDAEEYLDRITEQYGPGHDETRYAAQLVADARTAHQCGKACGRGPSMFIDAVEAAITAEARIYSLATPGDQA